VYWLKTYEIPEASRAARGRPLVNLLPLDSDEYITTMLPVDEYTEGHFIFMATAKGTVKKTPLESFSRQRSVGLIALELDEGDVLISAAITDGEREVMLFSDGGKVTRFKETDVRAMGRTARGVRGMRLPEGQKLISMLIPEEGSQILTASARGFGKRTAITEFPEYKRGGQGVIAMVSNDRNGRLVGAVQVLDGEEIMLISDQGTLVRTRVDEVSSLGRNTQGVTLIKLASDETLVGLERVQEPSEVEGEELEEGEEGAVFDGEVVIDDVVEDQQLDAAADEEPQE
jgi:DNA gyrase subunit A